MIAGADARTAPGKRIRSLPLKTTFEERITARGLSVFESFG
jgi:hypothetical protein